jgi:hypothetical protein
MLSHSFKGSVYFNKNSGLGVNRLYMPGSTAAPVSPVANSAEWTDLGAANRKLLHVLVDNAEVVTYTSWAASDPNDEILDRIYVSDKLIAQTITGPVKMQLQTFHPSASTLILGSLELYVVNQAGTTVRGTLLSLMNCIPNTTFNSTTKRNKTWLDGSQAVSSLTVQNGDRLVLKIGFRDSHAGGSPDGSSVYVTSTTSGDLPEDETNTDSKNPWIEFTNKVYFQLQQ